MFFHIEPIKNNLEVTESLFFIFYVKTHVGPSKGNRSFQEEEEEGWAWKSYQREEEEEERVLANGMEFLPSTSYAAAAGGGPL